ncbi:hypothetical protein A2U01_0061515, partial [Trifolium medium]|nr:hypothetical protein [Trifolium medium]
EFLGEPRAKLEAEQPGLGTLAERGNSLFLARNLKFFCLVSLGLASLR